MPEFTPQDLAKITEGLHTVGQTDNKADTLRAITSLGLQIAQSLYLDSKKEVGDDFIAAAKSASASINNVDYTLSGTTLTNAQGVEYDPYDKSYNLAKSAVENLAKLKDNPALHNKHDDIDLLLSEYTQILAHKDAMKDQRIEHLDNLENLTTDYMTLVKSDPSMTEPVDWKNAIDIIDKIELTYRNLESNSGKKIPAEKTIQFSDILKTHELLGNARSADVNESLGGFQIALNDEASPYLQQMFKKMGIEQVRPELEEATGDEVTYMPPSEIEGFERIYEAPDIDLYAEANAAFNKWQGIQTELEVKNLIYAQTAEERRPFEIMRDRMEAPGDPDQLAGANVIAFQFFSGTKNTFQENIADIPSGPYKDDLITLYDKLAVLHLEGRHKTEFANMQTTYNKRKKAELKATGLTIGQIDDVFASAIRTTSSATNDALTTYNNQFDKDDPRRIVDIPVFSEKTLGATTKESKIQHIESMNKLLKRANAGEWTAGNEPGGEIRLIRDYETAEGEAKWVAIQKLVDTYLTPAGTRENEDEIIAAFDADYMGGTREENEVEVFYALLRSWQAVSNADDTGTTLLSYLGFLSKQGK